MVSHRVGYLGNGDRLPALAQSITTFDGTYAGVSLQGTGNAKGCTTSSTVPRPLTISGGNAKTVMGAQGDLVFQGTVSAQGVLSMKGSSGGLLTGKVDGSGNASGAVSGSLCTYTMTWRKQ